MNIILCGLPASGKTTIGKLVANHLGYKHIDTDELIIQQYGDKNIFCCRQLYLQKGEEFFRQAENQQVLTLLTVKNCVISLGGGTLSYFDHEKMLKKIGGLIYLKADIFRLWQRVEKRGIPSYLNQKCPQAHFYQIMTERHLKLVEAADYIFDTNLLTSTEVISHLISKFKICYGK